MFKYKDGYLAFLIVAIHSLILLFLTSELSINYYEANTYFNEHNLLHYIVKLSTNLFSQNDLYLRLPMILMYAVGALLYYDIGKPLFKKPSDNIWNLLIYILLPGVNSAAIMVDGAGLVLFLLLLFLFFYERNRTISYILFFSYVFVDSSFVFLYLSFIFYAMHKRQGPLLVASIALFALSMYLFGIDVGGRPANYFLNTLGVYGAIFSPIIFIYLIYSLYRWAIKEKLTLMWFLGVTAFLFSLLLSFRQQMKLEELAPYLLISTPIMVKTFLSSYRIRLREFRKKYRVLLFAGLLLLVTSTLVIYFNKYLYLVIPKPSKHFVYNNHVIKELSLELKKMGITQISTSDTRTQERLKFYGIKRGGSWGLYKKEPSVASKIVTISYNGKKIASFYVAKLHKR